MHGRIVVRLKAIKYKENFSYYLSSYPLDLSLQAASFLTLFFQSYAFRTFVSSMERICLLKLFRIPDPFYNLNPYLLGSLRTSKGQLFS